MNTVRSMAYAIFLLAVLTAGIHPLAASCLDAEEEQVVDALRRFMVALKTDDMAAYSAVTTPDFHAFDMGYDMTADQLIGVVRNARESGVTLNWQVTEPRVRIDGTTAWITYVNRGSIQKGTETNDVTWLESAVLSKVDDSWRIQFVHSTPAAGPGE